MKKLLAAGVAAAIAMGSVAAATTTATAQPGHSMQWWKKGQNGNNWKGNNWKGNNWNNRWANNNWRYRGHGYGYGSPFLPLIIGGAIGYGIGQSYAPRAYDYDYGSGGNYSEAHVRWCLQHYPNTYNPNTNLYNPRAGVKAQCFSPYYG